MEEDETPAPARKQWRSAWTVGLIGIGTVIAIVALFVMTKVEMSKRTGVTRTAAGSYYFAPASIDSASTDVRRAVSERMLPGAALAIGDRKRIVELAGFGHTGWADTTEVVSPDSTMYDLASLTKAVATTTATLLLVQDGRIRLDDPVQRWLPEFAGEWKERVTWRHLLTHTAGLPAGSKVKGGWPGQRLQNIIRAPLDEPPGTTVQYSDVSFIILWAAAERAAGEPLPTFLERRLFRPLGMQSTAFWPGPECENCAPTQLLATGIPYRGKPSDPVAHKIGVPTGNAGLFSTAHDMARFATMMANGGVVGRVRILRSDLVRQLFTQQPDAGHRSLGWSAFCPDEKLTQQQPCSHPTAFGHTGWSGTSLWIDPARGMWVVILSNRAYNVKRPPSLDSLRADVFFDAAGLDTGADVEVRVRRADSAAGSLPAHR